jgi:hypothetical protein
MKPFSLLTLVLLSIILPSCNDNSVEMDVYPNILEPSTFRSLNTKVLVAENDVWENYTLTSTQSSSIDTALEMIKELFEEGDYFEFFQPHRGFELLSETEIRVFEILDSITIGRDTIVPYEIGDGVLRIPFDTIYEGLFHYENNEFFLKMDISFVINEDGRVQQDLVEFSGPDLPGNFEDTRIDDFEGTDALIGPFGYKNGDILVVVVTKLIFE